jgi:ubiquinone/menaquinone biosynthesis C-methylase UbiE
MDENKISEILSETERGYDEMSEKFSETRSRFWHGLEFISKYTKDGYRILDFGCGNGRLLELFTDKNIDYLGLDVSEKLIGLAREKYPEMADKFQKISGSSSLTFPENSFNATYSIAVFHHLPSAALRLKITKELFRVLKPQGAIVVTVWNLWQRKYLKYIILNWFGKFLGKSGLNWNDCYIPFKDNQGKVFQRYHHAWTRRELKSIFEAVGFKIEKCEIIDRKNILLIGRK